MRRMIAMLAAAAALAGCGASHAITQAFDPVARAADVTSQVPGYRMQATMRVTSAMTTVNGTMTGVIDRVDRRGALQLHETVAGRPLTSEVRFSGTTMYMRAAGLGPMSRLTGGKPWIELDFSKAMAASGLGGLPIGGTDPSQFVDYLRVLGVHPRLIGAATISGVATRHYHVAVPLDRYPELVAPAQRSQARQSVTTLESLLGAHTLPMDVWIDAHHLIRRMQFAFHECVAGQHIDLAMTMNLSDYGPQPAITTPSASRSYDATPLLSRETGAVTHLGCTS